MNSTKYDDIINLPHYVSSKYPRMSLEERSAQFAPFSALTGYAEAIKESERLTDKRKDIDESSRSVLDSKLQFIQEHLGMGFDFTFTYFVPDLRKDGGKYVTVTKDVKRIDNYRHVIVFDDLTEISIFEIIDIEGGVFEV